MYKTKAMKSTAKLFDAYQEKHFELILQYVKDMLQRKGEQYNALTTFNENMPFGDKSFATLVWIKAHRAASLTEGQRTPVGDDALDDVLLDLIVYTMTWMAYRRALVEADNK